MYTGISPALTSGRTLLSPCEGGRIRYVDLVELVRQDLESLLALNDGEVEVLVQEAVRRAGSEETLKTRQLKKERADRMTDA